MQQQQLKYTLSGTVVFVFQSQIQICCAFFKWSDSSEDVGKQKIFCIPSIRHPSGLVWCTEPGVRYIDSLNFEYKISSKISEYFYTYSFLLSFYFYFKILLLMCMPVSSSSSSSISSSTMDSVNILLSEWKVNQQLGTPGLVLRRRNTLHSQGRPVGTMFLIKRC